MISLNTLKNATSQEVFDHVVNHLRNQGVMSTNENGICSYRGTGNLMCAAGCLISDDEYRPDMDSYGNGKDWETLVTDGDVPSAHFDLISSLQNVHDWGAQHWEIGFSRTADTFNLKYEPI